MIRQPRPGQLVQVWYARDKIRRSPETFPWHGRVGVVARVGRGPGPKNASVKIDGESVVVARGNLRPAEG